MKRLRVLMSAYGCVPGKGSEPSVGWNFARSMAKHHDIFVLTKPMHKVHIEKELAAHPIEGLQFIYFDLPKWLIWWYKDQRGLRLHYYLWQVGIYFYIKKHLSYLQFDLIHHVTFVMYWMPSFISFLPVPFIWGPVGGGENVPRKFFDTFSWRGKIYEILRDCAHYLGEKDWFVQATARNAKVILTTTEETKYRVEKILGQSTGKIRVLPAAGLLADEIIDISSEAETKPKEFTILCVGRLECLKGFHLALQAFKLFYQHNRNSVCLIVGDGPERHRLQSMARNLNINHAVKFMGNLKRRDVFKLYGHAHVLLHPALHDSGGFVCLEAMAATTPVIALNLGGSGKILNHGVGILVEPSSVDGAIQGLSKSLSLLADNDDDRVALGQAAYSRVCNIYNYDKMAEKINEIYQLAIVKNN